MYAIASAVPSARCGIGPDLGVAVGVGAEVAVDVDWGASIDSVSLGITAGPDFPVAVCEGSGEDKAGITGVGKLQDATAANRSMAGN